MLLLLPLLQSAAPTRGSPKGRPPANNMTLLPMMLLPPPLPLLLRHCGCVLHIGLPEEVATKAELPGMAASATSTRASVLSKAGEYGEDRLVVLVVIANVRLDCCDAAAATAAGPSARFMTDNS